jgi:signal transduction histidine kinase
VTESPNVPGSGIGSRSLAFRVIAFSTIWAVLALIVISTVISTLYRQASERGFASLLNAHLFNLISSVGVNDSGVLTGTPDLGDLRFSIPESGWYWSVEPVSEAVKGRLRSGSMIGEVSVPPVSQVPFNSDFRRTYESTGQSGETLQVVESEFELDQGNRVARFRVMGNRTEVFGIGMIAINAVAILLGLRPLRVVREALAQVREGTAKRLDGKFPSEIQPLANETNALIENNRRIVERSRTQVGNLAHSLKTPLAVLLNEGRMLGGAKGRLIEEQTAGMQQQIEHYLQRARVAAQRDSVVYRTPVTPLLERMGRVAEKLKPDMRITVSPTPNLLFAGEREDLEEIVGNLLDNAMKWGRQQIRIAARTLPSSDGKTQRFEMTVEDDGPGIPEDKAREALQRGKRLDETKPGTGLGLAIVADLVKEYGGTLRLEKSPLGGLRASVELTRVE